MVKIKKGLNPKNIQGNKSDLNPPVQIAKLLQDEKELERELDFIGKVLNSVRASNIRYYMIIKILFLTGSRIGEILNLKCSEIDQAGAIIIKGSKKGASIVFQDSEVSQWLLKLRHCEGLVFNGITRFHIYHCLRNFGFKFRQEGKINYKVTHYFRHLYVKRMRKMGADKDTIKTELKHRSNKSQNNYGNYQKK